MKLENIQLYQSHIPCSYFPDLSTLRNKFKLNIKDIKGWESLQDIHKLVQKPVNLNHTITYNFSDQVIDKTQLIELSLEIKQHYLKTPFTGLNMNLQCNRLKQPIIKSLEELLWSLTISEITLDLRLDQYFLYQPIALR